ncbi:MAG TPA: EF-hand domain-containing protein [Pedomonas sp.]|uniref:EF-hand domain-containing protein n=1 Tax=Pedomonas sp. TaxID=2976421 RepID=UPI002F42699B
MMRTSLCMAAFALLCSTSAIAQTSGSTGLGSTGSGSAGSGMSTGTQRPGGETGSMGGASGQSGSTMGGQSGSTGGMSGSGSMGQGSQGTMGSGSTGSGSTGSGSMGSGSMGSGSTGSGSMGGGTMGQDTMGGGAASQGMEQGSTTGQSAMESGTGQGQNFAAFDQNQDGSLDRAEFARALQVQGSAPAAGGESGVPARQTMRGDRAISPLNQSSIDFQRADANGDGKISQEEFSGSSPQQ